MQIIFDKKEIDIEIINSILKLFPNGIVSIDLETTGLSPLVDKIIEIGAIKINKDGKISTYQTLINPEIPIPPSTTKIHNIYDKDVLNSPTISSILPEFLNFIEELPIVAHNAKFDLGFIIFNMHQNQIGRPFETWKGSSVYCSCTLSRQVFKGKVSAHKLAVLTKELGIKLDNHHRALDDAIAAIKIFGLELIELEKKRITKERGIERSKIFSIGDFYGLNSFDIPKRLKLLKDHVQTQTPLEIFYTGGSPKNKNQFRKVKPISLLPMPAGNILYSLCMKDQVHKSFSLAKIREVRPIA